MNPSPVVQNSPTIRPGRTSVIDFSDKSKFFTVPDMVVLDVHVRRVKVGDNEEIIFPFSSEILNNIAENTNQRIRARNAYPTLFYGHRKREKEESELPEPVGFADNFRLAPMVDDSGIEIDSGPFIVCDFHFFNKHEEDWQTYPYRSVELDASINHPEISSIDAISCLRRAPERDLGIRITYERDGSYPMTNQEDEKMTPDEMNQFAELLGTKISEMVSKAITEAMAAKKDEEIKVDSEASAPSAMSVTIPEMEEPKVNDAKILMSKNENQVDLAKILASNNSLKAEIELLRNKLEITSQDAANSKFLFEKAAIDKSFSELENEGIIFDQDQERERLSRMSIEDRKAHFDSMKLNYQRVPSRDFIPLSPGHQRKNGPAKGTQEYTKAVIAYASTKQGIDSYEKAKAAYDAACSAGVI